MAPRRYLERRPPPELARHVACLWSVSVGDEPFVHRVDPDGCADIVVFDGSEPHAVGPAKEAVSVPMPAGGLVVGARFRPGMAARGFGVPASELRGADAPLSAIWSAADAGELEERVAAAVTAEAKIEALGRLLARGIGRPRAVDDAVEHAVLAVAADPSGPVAEIGDALSLSSRQLLRRFSEHVGYGPKTLQRVLRYQRLLLLAAAAPEAKLSALAQGAGYVDQPHMNRDVLELAGQAPSQALRGWWTSRSMSDFFKTADSARSKTST